MSPCFARGLRDDGSTVWICAHGGRFRSRRKTARRYQSAGSLAGTDSAETAGFDRWAETAHLAGAGEACYLRSFATLDINRALAWSKEAVKREPGHPYALECVAYLSDLT
jgi:hypothetical protein